MIRLKERVITAAGSLVFGITIILVYIYKHAVPMTSIYLGSDRTTHVKVVFVAGVLGLICLILSQKAVKLKWLRVSGYVISSFLMVVLPLLILLKQSGSFRGLEWALETLIIGIVPLLFLYAAYLVFYGNRIVSFLLALVFSAFSLYHLLLLLKVFRGVGRAFSPTGKSDIMIMLSLILSSAIFAVFSFKHFLKQRN